MREAVDRYAAGRDIAVQNTIIERERRRRLVSDTNTATTCDFPVWYTYTSTSENSPLVATSFRATSLKSRLTRATRRREAIAEPKNPLKRYEYACN
ncbi:hypothetical protein RB195_012464 [Necator americanus]|uniref:Uncharacterized protein n=1 Tax=Necator americanus TaxID=51031 RepID=A0ABR1D7B8_NECAM